MAGYYTDDGSVERQVLCIFNPSTRTELFGTMYSESFTDRENNFCGPINVYKLDDENKCHERPVGLALVDLLSLEKEELDGLINELVKDSSGYISDFEELIDTPLHPYAFLSRCGASKETLTVSLESIFSVISTIKLYIDLCNENPAFFVRSWYEIFMETVKAKRDAEKDNGAKETDYETYTTDVIAFVDDKLIYSEIGFGVTYPKEMFKPNIFSESIYENEKAPLVLSPEQKQVSKTMVAIESYEHPFACYYRSLEFLIEHKIMPKRCRNCWKYFMPDKRSDTQYCSRPTSADDKKTCREYGSVRAWKNNMDEAAMLYRKIYKRKQARASLRPSEEAQLDFENYKKESKQWRDDVKSGAKTEADFIEWLKSL